MMQTRSAFLVLCLLLASTSGCVTIGPRILEGERIDYNVAIQRSNDEQLLLNLVRLKYRGSPYFLEVNSVSSQITFQRNISATGTLTQFIGGGTDSKVASGSVTGVFAERPTVSYSPLRGDDYIRRLLSPIGTDRILLLSRSGWDMDQVFRLTVQSLNGVKNAPTASGPTPSAVPEYGAFAAASQLLPELVRQDAIRLTYQKSKQGPQLLLTVTGHGRELPSTRSFQELLRLDGQRLRYFLSPAQEPPGKNEYINLQTRSLMGMMFYLSHGISIPEDHAGKGKVTITRDDDGNVFDWNEVTGDLFRVRTSRLRPTEAAVAISYRGHWFYIDDSDLQSKSTFALLAQITTLQAGKAKDTGPVLTLPVGG